MAGNERKHQHLFKDAPDEECLRELCLVDGVRA
jgi:hypothetical protein